MKRGTHTVELNATELLIVLAALDLERAAATTTYGRRQTNKLYTRLRDLPPAKAPSRVGQA